MSNPTCSHGGGLLRDQGRTVLEEARKPLLAVVGAGDLAVSQVREQLKDLSTQAEVRRLSARAAQLPHRVRRLNSAALRQTVETYLTQARSVYEELAERGEQVMNRARQQPGVRAALGVLAGRSSTRAPADPVVGVRRADGRPARAGSGAARGRDDDAPTADQNG